MNSNKKTAKMNEVSLFRLYLLRSLYLLIVVGLGIMRWPEVINIHPSRKALGTDGRSGRLHADRLFGSVNPGAAVSAADAAFASVGIGVEVDLADRRCAPTVVSRSNGRINLGDGLCLLDGRDCSFRHSLALCVCTLREEARRSVALREAGQRSPRPPLISRMCIGKEAPSPLSGRIGLCFSQFY